MGGFGPLPPFTMTIPVRARRKSDARIKTLCRRGVLKRVTATPPVSLDRPFLRALYRQDPMVEIHWYGAAGKFVLYRRVSGQGREDSDLLIRELTFGETGTPTLPGGWLLEWMKWADKYASGAVNPELARINYLTSLDEHERKRLESFDKARMDMSEEVAKHLSWCIDGRISFSGGWKRPRHPNKRVAG